MKILSFVDKTFYRFILVGMINTLVGSAIMFGCYNLLDFSYWVSSLLNYTLTSILSYFLNKHYTFKNKDKGFMPVMKFALNIAICYFVSYGIARQAVSVVLSKMDVAVKDNVSMLVGMGLFVVSNYLGQRLVVFASKHRKQAK